VTAEVRPRVLCVADEPQVLEGLSANLRRRFTVLTAGGGTAALTLLAAGPAPMVIVSDMRMPGMDGATFLAKARVAHPDSVRVLLTGHADMASAIAAVNEGQIFRFLTKPCPAPSLIATLDAAVEQHRLVTAERVLLEQTLHGCIKTLTEVLALTNPVAFGRATRIKLRVAEIATALDLRDRWQVEVAAMLSQLGAITLPPETAERLYFGHALGLDEQKMVARLPAVTEQLLGNIPRLEEVRAILAAYPAPPRAETEPARVRVAHRAAILRAAVDFDALATQGSTPALAIEALRSRGDRYDPAVVAALDELHGSRRRVEIQELKVAALCPGMVLAEDVTRVDGMLLLARGVEITMSFIERILNFPRGAVREPIRVLVQVERSVADVAVAR